jgi:uncharacterized protein DUF5989
MSAAVGSSVSSSTEARPIVVAGPAAPRAGGEYLAALARRREAAAIRRQIGYGLVVGWVLTLVCGFFFYCLASRAAWVWGALMVVGLIQLGLAVVLPQVLAWPERVWSAIAQWQGKLVMGLLLTIVYFGLLWPARRLRQVPSEFHSWDEQPPESATAWQPLPAEEAEDAAAQNRQRSLPVLLAAVVAFFIRRKQYVLLPILILLLILGLALFFVQSSAIAPFIYTLF